MNNLLVPLLCVVVLCLVVPGVTTQECTEVCFEGLECFTNCPPWDIFPLPNDPERIGTQFWLFTRQTGEDFENITESDLGSFQGRPTWFIAHGFTSRGDDPWVLNMRREILVKEDINVVVVDWRRGALPDPEAPAQPIPASNTRVVGRQIRNLVNVMIAERGLSLGQVYCGGHSLGSHLCAFFAKEFPSPKIARISGFDPAGQLFDQDNPSLRLTDTDATYVDAIHTNALGVGNSGINRNVGHSDFWVHRGGRQPGCEGGVCDHFRAMPLFTESINSQCEFNARVCFSYDDMMEEGACDSRSCFDTSCGRLGYYSDTRNLRGTFYLETADSEPFCLDCCSP